MFRHYESQKYSFQVSWQKSEAHCEEFGASLISIWDEAEAEVLKHAFSTDWFWDPVASFQINHRVIYIGLIDRDGKYIWKDNTPLA